MKITFGTLVNAFNFPAINNFFYSKIFNVPCEKFQTLIEIFKVETTQKVHQPSLIRSPFHN